MPHGGTEQGIGIRKGTKVTLRPWKNHPAYKHRVSWIEDGRSRDRGFKLKKDATAFQAEKEAELRTFGTSIAPTSQERAALAESRVMLEEAGLSLREAIKIALDVHQRDTASVPVNEVVAGLIEAKSTVGRSDRHLGDLRYRLGEFEKEFGDRLISSIECDEVFDWIVKKSDSPVSRNNFRTVLRNLFNYAKKRNYCSGNPIDLIDRWKGNKQEVEILEPEELVEILETALDSLIPVIAIGAFAGLRRTEIERLDWSDIDFETEEIFVRAKNLKSAANRFVPFEANLGAWLKPYALRCGRVWPSGGAKQFAETNRKVSFKVPQNALRHSYGSYHLAKFNNGPLTSLNMGHSNQKQVFESYRKPIKKPMIAAYWSIEPGILTPQEASDLLTAADEGIRAGIALSLFAGLQAIEVQRVTWEEIDLSRDLIELKPKARKEAARRVIPMRPNLKAWLLLSENRNGRVVPQGKEWKPAFAAARRSAGFAVRLNSGENKEPRGKAWKVNAMRHSFASYGIQSEQDAAKIALELGHRGSTQTLFEHYRATCEPEEAEAYWNIFPEEEDKVVNIA